MTATTLPVSVSDVTKIRGMCVRSECEMQVDVSLMGDKVFFSGRLIFHTSLREFGSADCTNMLYTLYL